MTTSQAAKYLGISMQYLRNMRLGMHNHDGPPYVWGMSPTGKACIYSQQDLDAWSSQHNWKVKRS